MINFKTKYGSFISLGQHFLNTELVEILLLVGDRSRFHYSWCSCDLTRASMVISPQLSSGLVPFNSTASSNPSTCEKLQAQTPQKGCDESHMQYFNIYRLDIRRLSVPNLTNTLQNFRINYS